MLVGAENKIMGWRNDMLGHGKKKWLTPAMSKDHQQLSKHSENWMNESDNY